MSFRITTDSTVDLTPMRLDELQVPFASLHLSLDGEELDDDMRPETAQHLYVSMRGGKIGTTSQATVESFLSQWEPMVQAGEDILYIGFSSALSGTVNSATIARQQLLETYPEACIMIVDSLCASAGEGLLLEHACMLRDSGMSCKETYKTIENMKLKVHHWFTVDDLTYLRRGGRVSGASAFVATLLGIKPVMHVNDEGKLIPLEKVKGRRKAIKRLYEHLLEKMDAAATKIVTISQADCIEDAKRLKDMILEKFPMIPVNIYSVGAVIGAHSGPGTLALFFIGKQNTRQSMG